MRLGEGEISYGVATKRSTKIAVKEIEKAVVEHHIERVNYREEDGQKISTGTAGYSQQCSVKMEVDEEQVCSMLVTKQLN